MDAKIEINSFQYKYTQSLNYKNTIDEIFNFGDFFTLKFMIQDNYELQIKLAILLNIFCLWGLSTGYHSHSYPLNPKVPRKIHKLSSFTKT